MGTVAGNSVRRRAFGAAAVSLGIVLAACGGAHSKGIAGGAEPAVAPEALQAPAGSSVPVGALPEGIVVDPRTQLVVVAVRDPPQLVLLAAGTGRVLRRVPIPAPARHLELAAAGGPVLVPAGVSDRLLELDLATPRVRSIMVGALPHDAAVAAGRVFVGNEFGRSVSVVVGARVVGQIDGFSQPGGLATVGSDVAVVDVSADVVTLIDAHSLRVLGRLGAGTGPTHAVAGPDGRLYVVDTRGGAVLAYAIRPGFRLLSRFALPGRPYGIAIDPRRARLWVTLTATNQLIELATAYGSLRILARFATGRQPNTVAVDPHSGRVFVANSRAGTVQLIDP